MDRTRRSCLVWREGEVVAARVLAIDFGLRRIGLALSDPLGITAQGLPSLERTRLEEDLRGIEKLAKEHSVELVILGNPIAHHGGETGMSRRVGEFAAKLRQRLSCPVELWDERLTSVEANRMLRISGISIRKRRQAADRVAAALLLQSYLDYHANEEERRRAFGADR